MYRLPTPKIPVLAETDVAVIGGSFAGVSAALELAGRGKRVFVIEPRTYLGNEMTATLRPWIPKETLERSFVMDSCVEHCGKEVRTSEGEYVVFQRDRLKIHLEDLLLEAGVKLLYASLPVGITRLEDGANGLVIANKSGMQRVRCTWLVDATETAVSAFFTGKGYVQGPFGRKALYQRVLEFDRVKGMGLSRIPVPKKLKVAGDEVRIYPGYQGEGHIFVEYGMLLGSENSLEESRRREWIAQKRGIELAEYLIRRVSAFKDSLLCSASYELTGPYPEEKGERRKGIPFLDMDAVKGDQPDRWCFFRDFYENGNRVWLDASTAAACGERFGKELAGRSPESAHQSGTEPEDSESSLPYFVAVGDHFLDDLPMEESSPIFASRVERTELLVAGGGSSGAPAAIVSAREGVETVLVDLNPGLGGTGTFGGVDSYWFGNRMGFSERIHRLVGEIHERIRWKSNKWNIEAKKYVFAALAERYGVKLWLNAILFGGLMDGDRVCGALVATRWGTRVLLADLVIDATGDGDMAAFAGAGFQYGAGRDHLVMWYSLAQYKAPGKLQNNFTSMVNVSDIRDYTRAILAGRRRWRKEDDFAHDHGVYVAPRESRHILGDVVMTLTDQLLHRKWPDCINIHFSNHDMKGINEEKWLNVGLIPPNLEIEIPYRMLLPKGLEGILVVGKALSATHDALPAIRMQSDLENLGGVAALAAAMAIKEKKPPREIDVRELQRRLVDEGLLPERVLSRDLVPLCYSNRDLEALVDSIEVNQPLYEYSNMRMNEVFRDRIPFVEICTVGPRILPFLERAHERADGVRKIRLAVALALYGSKTGVPTLISAIHATLSGGKLPKRTADILYVTEPPDHGAMPDVCYLLYALAYARDKRSIPLWRRVAELLHPGEEDFKDSKGGLFYYIHSICFGAERLGDEEAVPVLKRLHRIRWLNNLQSHEPYEVDYFRERRAILELAIGRALARCGSPVGYEVLIDYLGDNRSLLAMQAETELKRLTSKTFGKDRQAWMAWLSKHRFHLRPQPLPQESGGEWSEQIPRIEILP